jgi:integrase
VSIKLIDGDRYMVRVYNPNGREYRKVVHGKRAATAHEAKMRTLFAEGVNYDSSKVTFAEYAHEWIAARSVKPVTRVGYHRLLTTAIEPHLPRMQLRAWKHLTAQTFTRDLAASGVAVSTQRRALTLMRSVFTSAVRDGMIQRNPFDGIPLPHAGRDTRPLPAWEDVRAVVAMQGTAPAGVRLIATTGLRIGEACAVGWDDLDIEHGTLRVERTLVALNPKQAKAAGVDTLAYLARPKSTAGVREIPLPPSTVEWLSRTDPRGIRKVTLPHYGGGTTTFRPLLASARASFLTPSNLSTAMIRRTKLPPHRLRHLYATTLEQGGVPLSTVQSILGHAPIGVTLAIYTHVQPHTLELARDLIESHLNSAN